MCGNRKGSLTGPGVLDAGAPASTQLSIVSERGEL
jgi:hypothetical protein